jgi:hypothetical protein
MSKRIVAALSAAFLFAAGCAHEISSDERLDRETRRSDSMKSATADDLVKMRCDDITSELSKARDDSAPEEKRMGIRSSSTR